MSQDTKPAPREGLLLPILLPVGIFGVIALILFGFSRVLLSLSHHAATAVALVVAAAVVATAAVVASRERLTNGLLFSMIGVVAGVAMLAGGFALVTIGKETVGGGGSQAAHVALEAPKGAAATGYAETSLTFPADKPVILAFDNADVGVQHNVVIYSEDPAKKPQATALFTGDLVTGPGKQNYDIKPLTPGTYFFHCEVHPTTMTGAITVAGGGGPSGSAAGVTVTAKGLQFDTKEIHLTAGQPSTITFDNQDAGVPHDIAIATDGGFTNTLFTGDIITGVTSAEYHVPALDPGTYFFHCDVHPTMQGTVVVAAPSGDPSASPNAGSSP